jgi:hypothetical protein
MKPEYTYFEYRIVKRNLTEHRAYIPQIELDQDERTEIDLAIERTMKKLIGLEKTIKKWCQ